MQLKTVGESLTVTKTINEVLKSTSHLGNTLVDNTVRADALALALNGYSTEAIKSAIAQSTLNAEQIKAILSAKGLTDAEIQEVIATNALTASQSGAAASTLGLGAAFKSAGTAVKGLGASMKAFALSNPVLTAIAAIGVTIYGAVKAYDALTVSVEEANEAMNDAVSEYDSAKSSLESINSELEEQKKKMDELLSKDRLTYAEQGQLEELQAITKELLIQQDIEQRRADKASKEAADKTADAYKKQYGKYGQTEEDLQAKLSHELFPVPESADDITGMISAYIRAQELLEQSRKEFDDAVRKGRDTAAPAGDVQYYIDMADDYRQALDENISDLQEKRLALEDEYNKAAEKRRSGTEPLSSSEKEVIETYESIYDAMKMVYEYTDRNSWNSMEISSIFNTEGIEKTKEELIKMAEAGSLSPETLAQYPVLNSAVKDSEIFLKEGQTAAEAFCGEIAACAEKAGSLSDSLNSLPSSSFDIPAYKEQIDGIKSSISTLQSALSSLNKGELEGVQVIDLMQEFPALTPYIDLAADGFGNLSEGLSTLIAQQPDDLIQELEKLKDSLSTDEERAQVDLLIDSLQRLSSYGDTGMEAYAASVGSTWNGTADVIEGVTTQFENLAKVQELVAHGLTMTATQAAELAKIYPEILTNAELSASGQITLNKDIVENILKGDQSIIDGQVTKLEADKAVLAAKKEFAESQLNIVKQIGEGEGKVSKEAAEYALATADKKLESLIEMGTEEGRAYAETAESMAGNVDEYNRVVAQAAQDTSSNINEAAVSMADDIEKSMEASQESANGLIKKIHDVADAMEGAKTGQRRGSTETYYTRSPLPGTKKPVYETHTGNFAASLPEYRPHEFDFDEFQSSLEIDIQGYADAISAIDSQIEILKNLQSTFESNGGIGGHGYADRIKQLEKEREKINSAASSSAEETKETFDWAETALSRIQRTIKNLGNTVSATWKNWTKRNNALASELSAVREEIDLQKSAYDTYMQRAESTGLSDHYKGLVRNGSISIEDISDEALKEQIKTYKEWWTHATLSSNGQEKFYLTAGKPSRAL